MVKKIFFLFIILLQASLSQAYTLNDALQQAYKYNNSLKAAQILYEQKMIEADKGIYQILPNASVSATSSYLDYDSGFEKYNSVNFNINYSIPLGGGKFHDIKVASALKEVAHAKLHQTESYILLKATEAYIKYINSYNAYKVSSETLSLMLQHYDIAQQKSELGQLSKVDFAKIKQQLAAAKADTINAQSQLTDAEALYVHIIGVEPPQDMETPTEIPILPKLYQEALDIANNHNINLIFAKSEEELAHYKLNSAKSSVLPVINLSFNLKKNLDSEKSSGVPPVKSSSILASLDIPIFQNGLNGYSQIKQARLDVNRASYQYMETINDTKEKIKSDLESITINKAFIDAAKESVDAATINRDATLESYKLKANIITDLLKSERDLLSEKIKFINAQTKYLLSSYNLLSTCGILTFEYLNIKNDDEYND